MSIKRGITIADLNQCEAVYDLKKCKVIAPDYDKELEDFIKAYRKRLEPSQLKLLRLLRKVGGVYISARSLNTTDVDRARIEKITFAFSHFYASGEIVISIAI